MCWPRAARSAPAGLIRFLRKRINVVDEYHYDGEYQVDIELIEDVTWGVDKARVMWRKEAPAVEAPMSRV